VIVCAISLLAVAAIALFSWLEHRREREYLVTIRTYLERGMAPPPDLVRGPAVTPVMRIRRGLTAIAIGAALVVVFAVNPGVEGTWAVGLIPIAVGAARLAGALLRDPT
jgi:hypothetical protein